MSFFRVLVIVITYNGMKWIDKCIGGITQSLHPADTFIIDNGSTDGTQDYIKSKYPHVILHQCKKNLGFGAANNIGLKYAIDNEYDYVYLLNQDAWIFPETIDRLINAAKSNPQIGIFSPMQYAGDLVNLDAGFGTIFNKANNKCNSNVIPVPVIMAAHWFIPVHILNIVGGFSPTFFHYGEDYNYKDRLHYHGYQIGIVKNAIGVHDRYERPLTKEKRFYLKDTANLIRLSNPNNQFYFNLFLTLIYSLAFSIKSINTIPFKRMIIILSKIKEFKKNWHLSRREDCAFL